MVEKEFIRLKTSELKPYENNPRINDDAVKDVMEKWVCQRCAREKYEKPYKNEICKRDGCKGRFKKYTKCKCGKWFENSTSCKKYCSKKCESKGIHKIKLICFQCGKEFENFKSNCINNKKSFCCKKCLREYEKTLHEDRICKVCGKRFDIIKSVIRDSNATGEYCSKRCCDKSKEVENPVSYDAEFKRTKRKFFGGIRFCAFCGTTKNVQIHHIIPYRITKDNSINNLIPLCPKHHITIERDSRDFIETMKDKNIAKDMMNGLLRPIQKNTYRKVEKILKNNYENRKNSNRQIDAVGK